MVLIYSDTFCFIREIIPNNSHLVAKRIEIKKKLYCNHVDRVIITRLTPKKESSCQEKENNILCIWQSNNMLIWPTTESRHNWHDSR